MRKRSGSDPLTFATTCTFPLLVIGYVAGMVATSGDGPTPWWVWLIVAAIPATWLGAFWWASRD